MQKFVWIFKKILELVTLSAKSFGRELGGDFDSSHGGIFRNVADFVDLDTGFTSKRRFQLFCERGRLGVAAGKSAYETRKLRLRKSGREMDAGNAGASEELRKTFFTGGSPKWDAIEKNLISGGTEEKSAAYALIKRTTEFFPRSLKLSRGSHVSEFIKTCEFQQNVQAADKCPRAPT
ncbi:MAG TPA: hypothetical protein VJN93_01935 [Candidatus Acidoferrum sp.]|nr:hypothetical protein [Candidatus Acidoferrum sp.]